MSRLIRKVGEDNEREPTNQVQKMLLPMHNNCTLPDEVYSSACAELFPHAPDLFLDPQDMFDPVWMHICPRCWYEQQQWCRKSTIDPHREPEDIASKAPPTLTVRLLKGGLK